MRFLIAGLALVGGFVSARLLIQQGAFFSGIAALAVALATLVGIAKLASP